MDNQAKITQAIDLALIRELYREHAGALRDVRERQRALRQRRPGMKTQLDDLEAEVTYLLLRYFRPAKVVEIGSLHGWSTCWILHALADNCQGRLITMDLVDTAAWTVPGPLAAGRWEFRRGDARTLTTDWVADLDYLFIDADHRARFARWYLGDVFPRLRPGTPVSVHDVFHRARPLPLTEGAEVLRWLESSRTRWFTLARAKAAGAAAELNALRRDLGLTAAVHTGRDNPMIYFKLP
ncbi:class I SAM-dependent methyltransferase [Amycolatopsis alkalitolerans]|uniref:Class I SAM-dependent methyltransferase n=1 Tax=Amycolatopsis alkalitolerans TaxID=2547244 RepID=A0A5C4M0M9_9PSEU|nr:class I SAM-dependent methyltransferase [Amycolatopsis alkalitolerans]TNC23992.1 class I SAM-dependent methyltransferase [Amycolatopsis alkalitolerans]